jgi:hypothetical protein
MAGGSSLRQSMASRGILRWTITGSMQNAPAATATRHSRGTSRGGTGPDEESALAAGLVRLVLVVQLRPVLMGECLLQCCRGFGHPPPGVRHTHQKTRGDEVRHSPEGLKQLKCREPRDIDTDFRSSVRVCGQQNSDVGFEVRKRSVDCLGSHVDCHAVYEDGLFFDNRGGKHSQLGFILTSIGLKFLD